MSNIRLLGIRDYIVLIVLSVFLLSPFGFEILDYHGHYLAEIGVVVIVELMLALNTRFFKEIINRVLFKKSFILMSGMNLLAFCVGSIRFQQLEYPYADFRAIEFFFVAFFWAESIDIRAASRSIAMATFLLYASTVLSIIYQLQSTSGVKENYPILGPVALMFLSVRNNRPYQLLLTMGLGTYMAITSFYRSDWIIIGGSIGVCLGIVVLGRGRGKFLPLLLAILAAVVVGLGYFVGAVHNYFLSSTSRYIQSIGKAKNLIVFLQTGYTGNGSLHMRLLYYQFLLERWVVLIFPHGLGHKAVYGHISSFFSHRSGIPANTIDSGLFFWIWSFGYALTIFPVYAIGRRIKRIATGYGRRDAFLLMLMFGFFVSYLLVSGSMFSVIPTSIISGLFLGFVLPKTQLQSSGNQMDTDACQQVGVHYLNS